MVEVSVAPIQVTSRFGVLDTQKENRERKVGICF